MKCPACDGTGKPKALLPDGRVVEVAIVWSYSKPKCALCRGTGELAGKDEKSDLRAALVAAQQALTQLLLAVDYQRSESQEARTAINTVTEVLTRYPVQP